LRALILYRDSMARTFFCLFLSITIPISALASDISSQRVDQIFAVYDKPNSPGCSLGVIRNGEFAYRKSYGSASLELGVPLTTHSVFYMASVSKQFTGASIVLASEQGSLSLDDDVRKYIPELPDYGHRITVREMLHQTSGFRDFLSLVYLSGHDISDLSSATDVLNLIVRQRGLNHVPGEKFVYSNSNYFLLGVIVERATKKSLADFAAENIFKPLGMTHTRFYDDNTLVIPERVAAYDADKNGHFLVDWSTTYDIVGGGGLMSSVDDLLLWDNNFYANKLGNGTLVKELESQGVLNGGKRINYGVGLWMNHYRGLPIVEHSGGTFGYRTELLRFPEQHFSVIALCNLASANVESLARKIADLYLDGQLQSITASVKTSETFPDPTPFAGTYLDAQNHVVYVFTVKDGNLMAWGSVLSRFGANKFYDLVGNPIIFEESHGVMKAKLDLQGETYFDGKRVPEIHLSRADLNRFVGQYQSSELEAAYTIAIEQDDLILKNRSNPPVKLLPIAENEFYAGDRGAITFEVDGSHGVSGLKVFEQSVRGISFKKVN